MNTVESDQSHPGERLSSDQCCDCGSEKRVLKWIIRKKSVRPGNWVDRVLGIRGWELISQNFPNCAPPCSQIIVFLLLLWVKLSPISTPLPILRISPKSAGGPGLHWNQLPDPHIHCLKPLLMCPKNLFPLHYLLVVECQVWKVEQGHQPPVHFCCPCSVVFRVRVSCSDAAKLLF